MSKNTWRQKDGKKKRIMWWTASPQCGSVRVDSVEDFAYGSEILINAVDQVTDPHDAGARFECVRSNQSRSWTGASFGILLQNNQVKILQDLKEAAAARYWSEHVIMMQTEPSHSICTFVCMLWYWFHDYWFQLVRFEVISTRLICSWIIDADQMCLC